MNLSLCLYIHTNTGVPTQRFPFGARGVHLIFCNFRDGDNAHSRRGRAQIFFAPCSQRYDDRWLMIDDWWLMIDGWWFMIDDWWLMNDDWWLMIDEWLIMMISLWGKQWLHNLPRRALWHLRWCSFWASRRAIDYSFHLRSMHSWTIDRLIDWSMLDWSK